MEPTNIGCIYDTRTKKRAQLIEEQDYQRAIGALTDREYMNILSTRHEQDLKVKSRKEDLAVLAEMVKLAPKLAYEHPEAIGLGGELTGKSYATGKYGFHVAKTLGAINPDQFGTPKTTEELNTEDKAKLEASVTNQDRKSVV